jgi:hypothetical protein
MCRGNQNNRLALWLWLIIAAMVAAGLLGALVAFS